MNPFKAIAGVFVKLGALIMKAAAAAQAAGLTDEIVAVALPYVRTANAKFVDNAERREWCVKQLAGKGVPESIARLAIEMAFQLYRKELAKAGV